MPARERAWLIVRKSYQERECEVRFDNSMLHPPAPLFLKRREGNKPNTNLKSTRSYFLKKKGVRRIGKYRPASKRTWFIGLKN